MPSANSGSDVYRFHQSLSKHGVKFRGTSSYTPPLNQIDYSELFKKSSNFRCVYVKCDHFVTFLTNFERYIFGSQQTLPFLRPSQFFVASCLYQLAISKRIDLEPWIGLK